MKWQSFWSPESGTVCLTNAWLLLITAHNNLSSLDAAEDCCFKCAELYGQIMCSLSVTVCGPQASLFQARMLSIQKSTTWMCLSLLTSCMIWCTSVSSLSVAMPTSFSSRFGVILQSLTLWSNCSLLLGHCALLCAIVFLLFVSLVIAETNCWLMRWPTDARCHRFICLLLSHAFSL